MTVLITDPINEAGIQTLEDAGLDVETAYDVADGEIRERLDGIKALILRSNTQVTPELLDAAPDLQIVSRAGIGVDNINIDAASDRGVVVANAPDPNVRATAEHTIGLLFATLRSIPQAHARVTAGGWDKSEFVGEEVAGKTLGIVGLGRVGGRVAERVTALGMDVFVFDPYISAERAEQVGATLVDDIGTCLDKADVATVHTPLTPETEGLVGADELAHLDGGYLINAARGGIVDEDALIEAIDDGSLAGAALDVFETEPLPADHPLTEREAVITTPHLGASTESAQRDVAVLAADQVVAALGGEPVPHALNAPAVDEATYDRLRPYVTLANTAGQIAIALFDGRVETVSVTYRGDIADEDVEVVTASALEGVFSTVERSVTPVNAHSVADDRGVEVVELTKSDPAELTNLVRVTVEGGGETMTVAGTVLPGDQFRIVEIDEFRVDSAPTGELLVVYNEDVPGVIGHVGTVLGATAINIAGMDNARESVGGVALTVFSLDDPVPDDICADLAKDDRIFRVEMVTVE